MLIDILFRMSNPEENIKLEDVEKEAGAAPVDENNAESTDDEPQATLHEVDVMDLVKHMGLQQRLK